MGQETSPKRRLWGRQPRVGGEVGGTGGATFKSQKQFYCGHFMARVFSCGPWSGGCSVLQHRADAVLLNVPLLLASGGRKHPKEKNTPKRKTPKEREKHPKRRTPQREEHAKRKTPQSSLGHFLCLIPLVLSVVLTYTQTCSRHGGGADLGTLAQ